MVLRARKCAVRRPSSTIAIVEGGDWITDRQTRSRRGRGTTRTASARKKATTHHPYSLGWSPTIKVSSPLDSTNVREVSMIFDLVESIRIVIALIEFWVI
ncbi:hypothetical protein R3Q06_31860 [Rhodococcus erythropolis]|uniref:hypothetical protein n=1 Tax=Rhodococcus erythropolis TaxID=1833 RepID=UPI00294971F3|nr:hypothetical protein [Rhodococcus erythropolis]MDV6278077.1 hypothetical protein [Rhodococcus erythropolis]